MAGSAPVLVLEPDPSDPVDRLGDWLTDAGLTLEVRAATDGVPASLEGFAALVVMGGAAAAWEDERAPFLPAIRALLREAVATEVPTLGVCLGAQLLAYAHGGTVAPNPDGPEYGAQLVAKRGAAATDPLFRELPITPDV
ncbi:MAG: type 1 glutamine amidotransferase, partial [Jatrophihabitans sp.]